MKYLTLLALLFSILAGQGCSSENAATPGDNYRKAATGYQEKATQHQESQPDIAEMMERLAELNMEAARLADEGRINEMDWMEYKQIERIVNQSTKR